MQIHLLGQHHLCPPGNQNNSIGWKFCSITYMHLPLRRKRTLVITPLPTLLSTRLLHPQHIRGSLIQQTQDELPPAAKGAAVKGYFIPSMKG